MADMFKTLEAAGGRSGPEWLSSHPNPGNRSDAIVKEASMLRVEGNGDSGQFQSIKSRLAGMPPAYTAEQIAKGQATTGGRPAGTSSPRVVRVEPPANSYRTYQPSNFVRVSVPANWNAGSAAAATCSRTHSSCTQLRDGSLLNIIGVAPQSEAKTYERTFRYVRQPLQIAD